MEQRPPKLPKLAWVEEEEEGPGAAPAQETEEVVPFELPQDDAAVERTQEQDPARGRFRRTAQLVCKFIKRIRQEETSTMGTGLRAYSQIFKTKTSAALLSMLVQEGFCSPKQVPAMVRYIHQWLMANQFVEHRLNRTLLYLTKAQPADVVMTLLRVAPPCDRPCHTDTSALSAVSGGFAGNCGDVEDPPGALYPTFAVRTLMSLLCRMQHEDVVVAMERKCGWDTLLCADTHHYAVGLLAREMSCVSIPLRSQIIRYLLRLLSTQEPHWELPALAFLAEVLELLDLSEHGANRLQQILSRQLRSECRERRRLALRVLFEIIDDPSMSKKMWSLTESLVELLWDADGEIVSMTVMLLSFIILDNDMLIPSPMALQLVEALLPLFDHENSQVQLLSILLFRTLVTLPQEKEKKALKTHLCQSLLPLFFHCHDENQRVAEASLETLLCVVEFLKRSDLEKLVKDKKLWKFTECLLEEDTSRAAEHLRRALPYLPNPQESLREAAIRFMAVPSGGSVRHGPG
ncbi:uncharacterized protein LOC135305585 [Passer domesticus]|uniref:uncharacterized protein LOC135305585 n=1 Tax=Passer domesticus TaxID=48849 RepID=UPI0030FECA6F